MNGSSIIVGPLLKLHVEAAHYVLHQLGLPVESTRFLVSVLDKDPPSAQSQALQMLATDILPTVLGDRASGLSAFADIVGDEYLRKKCLEYGDWYVRLSAGSDDSRKVVGAALETLRAHSLSESVAPVPAAFAGCVNALYVSRERQAWEGVCGRLFSWLVQDAGQRGRTEGNPPRR